MLIKKKINKTITIEALRMRRIELVFNIPETMAYELIIIKLEIRILGTIFFSRLLIMDSKYPPFSCLDSNMLRFFLRFDNFNIKISFFT